LRSDEAFQAEHIPGSSLATYGLQDEAVWVDTVASWQKGHGRPLVLIGVESARMEHLRQALEDRSVGVLAVWEDALAQWVAEGYDVARIARLEGAALDADFDQWRVVDVREPYEWETGIIAGAILMPLAMVPERADELDSELAYAVICAHGQRSRLAANWLADHGFQVANVEGGMAQWPGAVVRPRRQEMES